MLDVSVDRSEARDMIFEVDEDRDGLVGWDDFANMWVRLKQPFTAITLDEPRRLFNLVDYLFEADIKRGKKKVTPPAACRLPPVSRRRRPCRVAARCPATAAAAALRARCGHGGGDQAHAACLWCRRYKCSLR